MFALKKPTRCSPVCIPPISFCYRAKFFPFMHTRSNWCNYRLATFLTVLVSILNLSVFMAAPHNFTSLKRTRRQSRYTDKGLQEDPTPAFSLRQDFQLILSVYHFVILLFHFNRNYSTLSAFVKIKV